MTDRPSTTGCDYDVAIVGGGPTGAAAGVFTARYGLETAIFDRGNSSLRRCAYLENYLGFPAGIDVETFYDLIHEQVERAGCELVQELVESVAPRDDCAGFDVETQDGRSLATRRLVAATRYGGEYLRGLDADERLFETHEHDGEEHEHLRRDYADEDGRTPIEDLYVAAPSEAADRQAIVAAGRGARVALTLVADVREERGYPEEFADHYDWVRRAANVGDEWLERDRWREFFDERAPGDLDLSDERRRELRETEIDRRLDTYVEPDTIDRRREAGHERLLAHVDDERLVEHLGDERLREAVDDERLLELVADEAILEAARAIDGEPASSGVSD